MSIYDQCERAQEQQDLRNEALEKAAIEYLEQTSDDQLLEFYDEISDLYLVIARKSIGENSALGEKLQELAASKGHVLHGQHDANTAGKS